MNIRIKPFNELTPRELHAAVRLRQEVFYLEQKVDCEDLDAIDPETFVLWAETAGATIGVLRIIPPDTICAEASVGRVAVAAGHRRRGVGRAMMLAALEFIDRTWHSSVRISAQQYIVPFYESLGFVIASERYMEAGIPHYKMIRNAWHG